MFGALVISYLFCGGAGAGALAVGSVASVALRRSNRLTPLGEGFPAQGERNAISRAYVAGFALLLFGAICLVADLGRADRISELLLSPSATYLNLGFFSLAILLLLGAVMAACAIFDVPACIGNLARAREITAIPVSLVVMAYTGLLLQGLQSVALWATPLVPVLFTLSSVSCGCAVLVICLWWASPDASAGPLAKGVLGIDLVTVALELVCAVAFIALSTASAHPAAAQSAQLLFWGGSNALPLAWWLGFMGCGIVVPLAFGAMARIRSSRRLAGTLCAVVAVLVLVGSASMRAGIVIAGSHADMGLAGLESIV